MNEIGTTVLMLPRRRQVTPSTEGQGSDQHKNKGQGSQHQDKGQSQGPFKKATVSHDPHPHHYDSHNNNSNDEDDDDDAIVLHVEIKFAEAGDRSYVNVVVWRPVPDAQGLCHQVTPLTTVTILYTPNLALVKRTKRRY